MSVFLARRLVDRKWRRPRLWSNAELRSVAPQFTGAVVNVSGWNDEDKEGRRYRDYFTGAASYVVTNWRGERGAQGHPEEIELNLEAPLPPNLEGGFDVVFNHTTLEHVFDLFTAFENLCRLSRDIVIIVAPCLQETHFTADYGDFWRFTPHSMRRLFECNGLTVVYESASPPEPNASIYLFYVGSRFPDRWRDRLPPSSLAERPLGDQIIRNDPFTLLASAVYRRLERFGPYRRFARRFIRKYMRDGSPPGGEDLAD